MKIRPLLTVLLVLIAAIAIPAFAQSDEKQEKDNIALALNWYRDVVTFGHMDLVSKYMAQDYIEHDPNVGTTLSNFVDYYGKLAPRPIKNPGPAPSQSFAKGDYVVMVWEKPDYDPRSGTPYKYFTYDIVRVKSGKIQEHWDSIRKGLTQD